MTEDYTADPVQFKQDCGNLSDSAFRLIGKEGEDRISMEEYNLVLRGYIMTDEKMNKEIYDLFRKPEEFDMPVSVIKNGWVEFMCGDNPHGPDTIFRYYQTNMQDQ